MDNSVQVFGIGNPLIDIVFQAQEIDLVTLKKDKGIMHLVDEDEQERILTYFHTNERVYCPGGAAPTTLMTLAGLGVKTAISGAVGQDEFGKIYKKRAIEYGVVSRLVSDVGSTGSSIILVTPDGERTMNTYLGRCREFGVSDIDEGLLASAQFLYFTGYMWDTERQKTAVRRAIEIAKQYKVRIAFDFADPFAVNRYKKDFLLLIENTVDVIFANRKEASLLFDTDSVEKSAQELGKRVDVVAIKMGKEGSLVVQDGRIEMVNGQPIQATDSTGAGDIYAAGFLSVLVQKYDAVAAATAAGFLAEEIIQRPGAQFSVEDFPRLKKSYKELL